MRETEMGGSKGYRGKEWLVKWKEENGRGSGRKGERGRERKEVLWQPNEERGWEPDSIPQQINAACWRPQRQRQQPWMQKRSLQSIRRAASPPPVTEWWKAAPVTALPSLLSLSLSPSLSLPLLPDKLPATLNLSTQGYTECTCELSMIQKEKFSQSWEKWHQTCISHIDCCLLVLGNEFLHHSQA